MSTYYTKPALPNVGNISEIIDINNISDETESAFNLLGSHMTISEKSTVSSATISPGAIVANTHGLTGRPYLTEIYLECISGEQGYSIGDNIYPLSCSVFQTTSNGGIFPLILDDLDLSLYSAATTAVFRAVNKSTYGIVVLDGTKWTMKIRSFLGGEASLSYFTKPTAVSGTSDETDFNSLADATEGAFNSLETNVGTGFFYEAALTEAYIGTVQTITAGTTLTLAHGLSALPILITTHLECIATDLGYAVGQEINLSAQQGCMGENTPSAGGLTIEADATNIKIHIYDDGGSNSIGVTDLSQLSSILTREFIDNTKWKVKVKAWV